MRSSNAREEIRALTDLSDLGLIGMRERVEALGGEFQIASEPGAGFLFCARVPAQAGLPLPTSGPNDAAADEAKSAK
ncbi:hypothetical protein NK8_41690 [Caballeronia sp. NK8]|nr:hypothetical protein NK8_41690 [Caballeronia sp. NK8]